MMWLKYAGTIEIIIALSGKHEKVPPLGEPQLHIEREMRCYTWVGMRGVRKEGGIKIL